MITFKTIRIPRAFLVLCLCLGLVGWLANSGLVQNQARQTPLQPLPVVSDGQLGDEPMVNQQGSIVADFSLVDINGSTVTLSSFRGRPVVLYFWASWCPYCIREMPGLENLPAKFSEHGLQLLAVNILEQPEKVRATARELGVSYPVLLDEDARVTRSFAIRATPTFILIDQDGVYRDIIVGSPRAGVLEAKLEPLFQK